MTEKLPLSIKPCKQVTGPARSREYGITVADAMPKKFCLEGARLYRMARRDFDVVRLLRDGSERVRLSQHDGSANR